MQPQDLNMTTTVTGHQLFLFVTLGDGGDGELAEAIDLLGQGMENVHDVDGGPSEEAFARGRFQLLRVERDSIRWYLDYVWQGFEPTRYAPDEKMKWHLQEI